MDSVKHPLDWWAYGGYPEVVRHTGWSPVRTRGEEKKAIRAHGWTRSATPDPNASAMLYCTADEPLALTQLHHVHISRIGFSYH